MRSLRGAAPRYLSATVGLIALWALRPEPSLAQSSKTPAPPSGSSPGGASPSISAAIPPVAAAPSAAAGAISSTARRLADALRPACSSAVVVGAPVRSDIAAPRAGELAFRYASLLAGMLGPCARSGKSPASLDAARATASSYRALIHVEIEIQDGELRATARLYPIPHNVWERSANPNPGPTVHAFASARIDAEVRSYLPTVALSALRAERAIMDESEVVALLCNDLDGDGALELLTVSRRNISVARVRQGKLSVLRREPWSSLSPIAPVPWREPLGSVAMPSAGIIDVGVTDRAHALRLDPFLRVQAVLEGIPVPQPTGDACVKVQPGLLADKIVACNSADRNVPIAQIGGGFDASAAARVVAVDGGVRDVWALRDSTEGSLLLRDGVGRTASIPRAGAQIAVADIDLDGRPEVVASRDVLDQRDDALVVHTWQDDGTVRDRLTVPVPSGVSAVAVCPPDGPGVRTVVLTTKNELWLLR